jgi:predicted transcriptional regulator
MMKPAKKRKLEAAGWKIGDAQDFLQMTDDDVAYVEMKLALSDMLKAKRQKQKISQVKLAALIDSSQSRVAKMESGDASVSIDLLVKSLLALGASRKDLARAISVGRVST